MDLQLRKKRQRLLDAEAWDILRHGSYGVLSTVSRDGWPYGVPMNYVVIGDHLYFHGASEGHKHNNLGYSNRACFTVVGSAEQVPDVLITRYKSVICFGTVHAVQGATEKQEIMFAFGAKYAPGAENEVRKSFLILDRTLILELIVDEINGKGNDGSY